MIDMHTHSHFSPDSWADPEENIQQALSNNLKYLAFTDHIDRFLEKNPLDYSFDVEEYFSVLGDLKDKYRNQIEILIGVEIGLGPDISYWMDEFMEKSPFDFSIGSIHSLDGEDIALNKEHLTQNPASYYQKYYETMFTCVKKTHNFQILGHIDYIDRYISDQNKIPDFSTYADIIDEILKVLIRTNRGIEYNTAGLRKRLPYANPKDAILKRYFELGGEIITISSDSHFSKDIGFHHKEAIDHLKNIGFKKLTVYKDKKISFLPL